jgi:hypothetical protein
MAMGNEIIVSANPDKQFVEGVISGTPKPGTVMQIKSSAGLIGGRFTYEVYNPDADGDRRTVFILLPDYLQGALMTAAYVDGTRGFLYVPRAGEEFNMLLGDVAGTGDVHTTGELLIVDKGTGKLVATTGSPESEPFRLLETLSALTADTLAHVLYTGY